MFANRSICVTQRSLPINIYRGDSIQLEFLIDLRNNPIAPANYKLQESDKLYIGIMQPDQLFEDAIVKKILTNESPTNKHGDPILYLNPIDTEYLMPGTYYLMAKLVQVDEEKNNVVTTVIPTTIFNIL